MRAIYVVLLSFLSSTALAEGDVLRSNELKNILCSDAINFQIEDLTATNVEQAIKGCTTGRFFVTKSVLNPQLNKVVLMDIEYGSLVNDFAFINGKATVTRTFETDTNGELKGRWTIAKHSVKAEPNQSLGTIVSQLVTELEQWVQNGSVYTETYELVSFDLKQEAKKLKANFEQEVTVNTSLAANLTHLVEAADDSVAVERLLKRLEKEKAIKAIISISPDSNVCTESEYCSWSYYYVYLTDGTRIVVNFDHTT